MRDKPIFMSAFVNTSEEQYASRILNTGNSGKEAVSSFIKPKKKMKSGEIVPFNLHQHLEITNAGTAQGLKEKPNF